LMASAAANDIKPRPTADWLVTNTILYGLALALAKASNACGRRGRLPTAHVIGAIFDNHTIAVQKDRWNTKYIIR